MTIENYYITGVHLTNTQNDISFHVQIYLPNDDDYTTNVIDIITIQLDSVRSAGYPTSPSGIQATTVTIISDDPPSAELDDDPIDTTTLYTPPQLSIYPYKFRLTLPTNFPTAVGLLLLASRQASWTTDIPKEFIPTHFPEDLRTRLQQQHPTITRAYNTPPPNPPAIHAPSTAQLLQASAPPNVSTT